jgi:hypothetical protein
MSAAIRIRHGELGLGWSYPDLRARLDRKVYDFCLFDGGVVWAYVPSGELHSFGAESTRRA